MLAPTDLRCSGKALAAALDQEHEQGDGNNDRPQGNERSQESVPARTAALRFPFLQAFLRPRTVHEAS